MEGMCQYEVKVNINKTCDHCIEHLEIGEKRKNNNTRNKPQSLNKEFHKRETHRFKV
jgi:hypothetical protein